MRTFKALALCTVLLPTLTSACEGECITNCTEKFIDKYNTPLDALLNQTNNQIAMRFSISLDSNCVKPLKDAYDTAAYSSYENAIFPSYFHGKCQQNGVEPEGCPNPDCPVVCGTPGSMVHFYDQLTEIVFDTAHSVWSNLTETNTPTFKSVSTCVRNAITRCQASSRPRSSRLFSELLFSSSSERGQPSARCYSKSLDNVDQNLASLLKANMVDSWDEACDKANGLSRCSWTKEMTEFILQFP